MAKVLTCAECGSAMVKPWCEALVHRVYCYFCSRTCWERFKAREWESEK